MVRLLFWVLKPMLVGYMDFENSYMERKHFIDVYSIYIITKLLYFQAFQTIRSFFVGSFNIFVPSQTGYLWLIILNKTANTTTFCVPAHINTAE